MCVSVPRWWLCALGASLAVGAATTHASAQAGTQDTPAVRAENLYKKGHALLEAGRYADACRDFEQSERLDPLLGTLLNLAYCHEHEGRTGSAWAEFTRAATDAAHAHDPREAFARDSARKLEPRVAWVELAIPPGQAVADVTVDGEPIAPQLPPRFATDPGSHTIALFIAGKRWQSPVVVAREKATVNLTVDAPAEHAVPVAPAPVPASEPAAPVVPAAQSPGPSAPPAEPTPATGGGRRTAGWIVGAVGVAGLGVGAVFGVETLVDKGRANQNGCTGGTGCVPGTQGHSIGEQAWTYSAISTAGFAVGLAGVAAGTWLLLTSRPSPGAATTAVALHVVPTAGPGGNGLVLAGTW